MLVSDSKMQGPGQMARGMTRRLVGVVRHFGEWIENAVGVVRR